MIRSHLGLPDLSIDQFVTALQTTVFDELCSFVHSLTNLYRDLK